MFYIEKLPNYHSIVQRRNSFNEKYILRHVSSQLEINERGVKSVLVKSAIPDVDYVINPYVGCEHGCVYCYARFMARYSGRSQNDWGHFVDVKVNAVDVLSHRLRKMKNKSRSCVVLSSVTDPYQPLEERYLITRKCIELLNENEFPISILTKSDLVCRDFDIISANSDNEVGFTIISNDESVREVLEPRARPIKARIKALQELGEAGIKSYVFVGPIIPYLGTDELYELIQTLVDKEVNYLMFDRINFKSGIRSRLLKTIETSFPSKYRAVLDVIDDIAYFDDLRNLIIDYTREMGVESRIIF